MIVVTYCMGNDGLFWNSIFEYVELHFMYIYIYISNVYKPLIEYKIDWVIMWLNITLLS